MKNRYIFVFAIFLLFAIQSCKKTETDIPKFTLTLVNDNVEPGEIVLAQANSEIKIESDAKITVNGTVVNVFSTEENQIGFLMPVLSSGKVLVDYSKIGISNTLEVNIKPYNMITDAGFEIDNFTSEIDKIIINFDEHVKSPIVNLDPEFVELLSYLNQTLKDNIKDLSVEEKIQFAYFLRSNMPAANESKLDSLSDNIYIKRNDNVDDAGESLFKVGKSFTKNVLIALPTLKAGLALAFLPSPALIDKLAAVGFLTVGIVKLTDAISDSKRIGNLVGVSDEIMEAVKRTTIAFSQNQEEKLYFKGSYRTLNNNDANSSNAFISTVFKSLSTLQTCYNNSVETANKVTAWFPWKTPKIPTYNSTIGKNNATKILNLPGNNLTISDVSNPNIQVSSIQEKDGLLLKASSKTITVETPFTFKVKFTDPNLGIIIEKQIDAVLKPVIYFLLKSNNDWVIPPTKFNNDEAQSFYLSTDMTTKADGIDYSKITFVDKSVDSKVKIAIFKNANNFALELSHNEAENQFNTIEIYYNGTFVQTIAAEILPKTLDKLLIAGSPWNIIYMVNDGEDFFKWALRGNYICQGITYWDEFRWKEATMSFVSGGGGAISATYEDKKQKIVTVGSDCQSNGTEILTTSETMQMDWTYNTQTNVIKIPLLINDDEDEFAVSVTNGIINLNGLYAQIKLQKP